MEIKLLLIQDYLLKQEQRLSNIENLLSSSKTVLNIDEVGLLTGLSKSTIYKFTHLGTIPHYKQAKHLYFDRAEIEAWLKKNKGYDAEETKKAASTHISLKKGGRNGN